MQRTNTPLMPPVSPQAMSMRESTATRMSKLSLDYFLEVNAASASGNTNANTNANASANASGDAQSQQESSTGPFTPFAPFSAAHASPPSSPSATVLSAVSAARPEEGTTTTTPDATSTVR